MSLSHHDSPPNRFRHRIRAAVEETIVAYDMLQAGDSVLVGVSGGADSVALLHLLVAASRTLPIRLGVVHLDHSLRHAESDRDAEFVACLALELGLPCYISKRDVRMVQKVQKIGLEAAARQVRYALFYSVADTHGYTKIATGHHQNDNAESILMDLFRGCGPRGISGIPPVRDGRIIRPLIGLSRSEIIGFLNEEGLAYRSDASNRDTRFLRNKIRHQLIPSLEATYNPRIVDTLNRLARIVGSEDAWFEDLIRPIFDAAVLPEMPDNLLALSLVAIGRQHIVIQRRMIRKGIFQVKGDLNRITLSHIEAVVHLLAKGRAHSSLDLPDRIRVCLKEDCLVFSKEETPLRSASASHRWHERVAFFHQLSEPGAVSLPEIEGHLVFSVLSSQQVPKPFPAGQGVGFLDMDRVGFPLTVRNVRRGDRFTPLGMSGSQKISTYFINHKIPRVQRATCPVVTDQNGTIIWVVGHRIDDGFRVSSSTRSVLKGELFLA